jgi:dUTP pyrophosphatase
VRPGEEVAIRFTVSDEFRDLAPPLYASDGAAGADLRAAVPQDLVVLPGARALVPTGLTLEIPRGFEAQVRARSGLALKKGLALANGVGTIDADYRGEVGVIVVNLGDEPVTIARGDRIAQLVVAPVARAVFTSAAGLEESVRGSGGFGSTGS